MPCWRIDPRRTVKFTPDTDIVVLESKSSKICGVGRSDGDKSRRFGVRWPRLAPGSRHSPLSSSLPVQTPPIVDDESKTTSDTTRWCDCKRTETRTNVKVEAFNMIVCWCGRCIDNGIPDKETERFDCSCDDGWRNGVYCRVCFSSSRIVSMTRFSTSSNQS